MQEAKGENEPLEMMSPSQVEYQRVMSENLNGDRLSHRIISYKEKAPTAPEGRWTSFVCCHCFCLFLEGVGVGWGRAAFCQLEVYPLRNSGDLPWGKPAVTEWHYTSNKSLMVCKYRDLYNLLFGTWYYGSATVRCFAGYCIRTHIWSVQNHSWNYFF